MNFGVYERAEKLIEMVMCTLDELCMCIQRYLWTSTLIIASQSFCRFPAISQHQTNVISYVCLTGVERCIKRQRLMRRIFNQKLKKMFMYICIVI